MSSCANFRALFLTVRNPSGIMWKKREQVKIFSIGFLIPDSTANAVMDELKKVKGIEDLGVLRNPGYLNFVLNWISR